MQKKVKKDRFVAGFLVAITAFSPIASALPTSVSASSTNSIVVEDETSDTGITVEDETSSGITVDDVESHVISIDFSSVNGEVVVKESNDSNGDTERHLRVVESSGKKSVSVSDKNGVILSQDALTDKAPYALVLNESVGTTYTIEAIADDGYDVATYSVTMDSGANKGMAQSVGFETDKYVTYKCGVSFNEDKIVKINFKPYDDEIIIEDASGTSGEIVVDGDIGEGSEKTDIKVDTESDKLKDEAFLNDSDYDTSKLAKSDFATKRIIVLANKDSDVIDAEHVIGQYGSLYVLQYSTEQQAMNAYTYYTSHAKAVEPDSIVQTADNDGISSVVITESNAVDIASKLDDMDMSNDTAANVIALIDTGVSDETKTIGRVSVLDGEVSVGTHGDEMADAILHQNEDAKILSIRAFNEDGTATMSSIIASMQYAIDNQVSIINLSMSAKSVLSNSVLTSYIKDIASKGIAVIGAAGNDNSDVKDFVPGDFSEVYVIGASDTNGTRASFSNYGETVDYNVVASSTSEAAAMFSGLVSRQGLDNLVVNDGLVYLPTYKVAVEDNIVSSIQVEDVSKSKTDMTTQYLLDNADSKYTKANKAVLMNAMAVMQTLADSSKISSDDTLFTIYGDEEKSKAILAGYDSVVNLYSLDDNSDYYVGKADTMFDDTATTVITADFSLYDDTGTAVDGCHYDSDTGIVYVPKKAFIQADGTEKFMNVEVQFLQSYMTNVSTRMNVSVTDGDTVTKYIIAGNAVDVVTEMYLNTDAKADEISVSINGGEPLENVYFDEDTKSLMIPMSPSVISDIDIVINRPTMASTIINFFTGDSTVYAASFSDMTALPVTKMTSGALTQGSTYSGTANVSYGSDIGKSASSHDYMYGIGGFVTGANVTATYNAVKDNNSDISDLAVTNLVSLNMTTSLGSGFAGVDWAGLTDYTLALKCGHGLNAATATPGNMNVDVHALKVTNDYAIIGIITPSVYTQTGVAIYKVPMEQKTGDLQITKALNLYNNTCQQMYNLGGSEVYPLSGATFKVYGPDSRNTLAGTVTSDANGNCSKITDLKAGTYYVYETSAPKNSIIPGNLKRGVAVTVKSGETATYTAENTITDDPSLVRMYKITKSGGSYGGNDGNISWNGTEFTLYYFNEEVTSANVNTYKTKVANGQYKAWTKWKMSDSGRLDYSKGQFIGGSYTPEWTYTNNATFPVGTYLLVETKAPTNYALPDVAIVSRIYMNGSNAKTDILASTVATGPVSGYANIGLTEAQTFPEPGTIPAGLKIQKYDADTKTAVAQGDANLAGIQYGVWNKSTNPVNVTVGGTTYTYNSGQQMTAITMTTNANGYAQTPCVLPNGKYEVKEISSNSTMRQTDTTTYTYTLNNNYATLPENSRFFPDGYSGESGSIHTGTNIHSGHTLPSNASYNYVYRAGLYLDKIDYELNKSTAQADASLANAQFKVVNASTNWVSTADGNTVYGTVKGNIGANVNYSTIASLANANTNNCVVSTLTTNASGHAQTDINTLPVGTYYIVETVAPEGYEINNQWVGKVVVTGSGTNNQLLPVQAVATGSMSAASGKQPEQVYQGGVHVQKFDSMRDNDASHGDANLSGAEFTIVNASKAAAVNSAGTTIPTSSISDSSVTYSQVKNAAASSTMQKITTNANGDATTGNKDLPYGTYYIIETKAPAGYFVNETWVGKVVVREDGKIYDVTTVRGSTHDTYNHTYYNKITDGDAYATRDQIYRSGLDIYKVDSQLLRYSVPHGDASLKNVEYTIINVSETSIRNKDNKDIASAKSLLSSNPSYEDVKKIVDSKNYTVQTIITDSDGYASTGVNDLPYGSYYVIETKPSEGYFIDTTFVGYVTVRDDSKMYHLRDTTTNASSLFYNIVDANRGTVNEQVFKGGVRVQKFDLMRDDDRAHGDANLSGAEFTIVNASKSISVNNKLSEITSTPISDATVTYAQVKAATATHAMQVITTDANGDAATGTHDLSYGTYYIIETKAPTGYYVNDTWVGKVIVREDGKMYDVTTVKGSSHDVYNHTYYPSIGKDATTAGENFATRDQIYRGGISLQKIDTEMKKQTPQGESELNNAKFVIINASDASIRNKDGYDIETIHTNTTISAQAELDAKCGSTDAMYEYLRGIADAGTNTVQTMTTNTEGFAITGTQDLPYGTYFVIEVESSYGYYIDKSFIGYVTVRDDGVIYHTGDTATDKQLGSFVNIADPSRTTVNQTPRRGDISFLKVNIDGEYKPYIPFMISAIRLNDDGTETILESHVVVSDEFGRIQTSKDRDTATVNGFDKYIENKTVTADGEALLKEASKWGVWFQGNSDTASKDAMDNTSGALYTGYYRITELHCNDNKDLEENLLASDRIYVDNTETELTDTLEPSNKNNELHIYHPLVDTEIVMNSDALDVESETKTVPARDAVDVQDYVEFTHVSADHTYRMETQFIDVTNGNKPLKIVGTKDSDAVITKDGLWVTKEFSPTKQSGTNNTYDNITMQATLNTKALNGHTIMAVDYLYQYIDISENDAVKGDWILVSIHPATGETDNNQMLYVPDMHTNAKDALTNDRVGTKSEADGVYDVVKYSNLSKSESYIVRMTLKDTTTGEYVVKDDNGNPVWSTSKSFFKRSNTPLSGTISIPTLNFDSSSFNNNKTVTVVEELYRASEDGDIMGEPILVHDSLLDEEQTIRWIDVYTTASDKNTVDTVGSNRDDVIVTDVVRLENVVFDDDDNDGKYTYKLVGDLVYQKDFTDADGVSHRAGDNVDLLRDNNSVVIESDAAGNISFTCSDGSVVNAKIVSSKNGMNVGNVVTDNKADNSYVTDTSTMICTLEVEMQFHVNSNKLAGGTVVAYEYLYHNADGSFDTQVSSHEDITEKGQTVHYSKIKTSALDTATGDDVGALRKDATIVDTVTLDNLVPGYEYQIVGKLAEQETGDDFLVNGSEVTQMTHITVTEDGKIVSSNGEKTTVTNYDSDKNEVSGTVGLTFTFDSRELENRTCVVFEDLRHNGITISTHSDLKDKSQTVHFAKIRTTNTDGYTKDHVATVTDKAAIVDTVEYSNLVIGREYTVSGKLMNKFTDEPLLDKEGNEVKSSYTFVAGKESDGVVVKETNDDYNRVSGTVDIKFEFDASLLEGTTVVAYEDLIHNDVIVGTHADIEDEDQTVHYPKVRTSAIDMTTGDEVGMVNQTAINDTVRLWNLIPGQTYEVQGVLMDKDTNEPLLVNGKEVKQTTEVKINSDGTVDTTVSPECTCDETTYCHCGAGAVKVMNYDFTNNYADVQVNLEFDLDASELEDKTVVVYEELYHNDVKVAYHTDINDLGQTIHFPKIRTEAVDIDTNDHAGTVKDNARVVDTVKYSNLVIGKIYEIKGTLYNQKSGAPILGVDGRPITATSTFTATRESDDVNNVLSVNEDNKVVSGEYTLTFIVDSTLLEGETVVVYEDLYHNDVLVTTHSDLKDKTQSVHYTDVTTKAVDESTGDHVGSIFGALINDIRHFFGEKDADGNGIEDSKQQNIVDTVSVSNLVPGYTYVVSGKLYNVDESLKQGKDIPLTIDDKEIVQAVTIIVSEDGKHIVASDGSKTKVVKYDKVNNRVDGTVDLVYTLDSSKVQGVETVVFEYLYHDSTYTKDTVATDVKEEDMINKHADINDKDQSVSEVDIHTTALDVSTNSHIGVVPQNGSVSVINDTVEMTKLVPDMDYMVKGYVVDLTKSDFSKGKIYYLAADGTSTTDKSLAISQVTKFTANDTTGSCELNFGIASDKVQGKTVTIFEELYHNDVVISIHPAGSIKDLNKDDFADQSVYYPTGKTNATDNTTGTHTSDVAGKRVVTDKVYFENLLVGEEYTIDGQLMYQSTFVDSDGETHQAGTVVKDGKASVTFKADADLKEATYVGSDNKATVENVTAVTYINGKTAISGYVNIEFTVDTNVLAGQSIVAFETFKRDDVVLFTHADINDVTQTIKVPAIKTSAKSLDLDEAAVYTENGLYKDITITDTVSYSNLWTQADFDAMSKAGNNIHYADGTEREQSFNIYDIKENASYVLKGTLMDKETGEVLKNADGKAYVVYSEAFSPKSSDGTYDVTFTVNAGDFVKDGVSELEGKSVVVYEDLYLATKSDECTENTHIGSHHDIDDVNQDIRFPNVRTHAINSATSSDVVEHDKEVASSIHEIYGTDAIQVTDSVSFSNLHGNTKYTVTGTLQVITKYDESGKPIAWETAKDDDGKVITTTVALDTTQYSDKFDDSVSGSIPLTFTFSGKALAGKTLVAFETVSRENVAVGIHADITDEKQTVYVPKISTNASEAVSGMSEALAGSNTVILDKVSYENLEKGKTYTLTATLHKFSDGSEIKETQVVGMFVAGTDNQVILKDGTSVMTVDELRSVLSGNNVTSGVTYEDITVVDVNDVSSTSNSTQATVDWSKNVKVEKLETIDKTDNMTNRVSGSVTVVFPVDTSKLGGDTVVAFEKLTVSDGSETEKVLATHEDINDENQSVNIPKIGTVATVEDGKTAYASKNMTIVDVVTFSNLTPGQEYIMHGVIVDKATGKSIDVVANRGFKPETADGAVKIEFTFDGTDLAGKDLVVFEELTAKNSDGKEYIVAEHKDINDEGQTVTIVKKPHVPIEVIDTGDKLLIGFAVVGLLMIIVLVGLYVVRKKRRHV